MTSANITSDPGAWFADGDVRVIGYHHYKPGKTVNVVDYFRNNPDRLESMGHLNSKAVRDITRFYGDLEVTITPRRGLLVGSTAIAQIPDSQVFIRAQSRVNSGRVDIDVDDDGVVTIGRIDSDMGSGSKAFGRRVATNRLLKALESILDAVTVQGTTAKGIRAQLSSHPDLYSRIVDSDLVEIVDEIDLTANERSLLRLPNVINA